MPAACQRRDQVSILGAGDWGLGSVPRARCQTACRGCPPSHHRAPGGWCSESIGVRKESRVLGTSSSFSRPGALSPRGGTREHRRQLKQIKMVSVQPSRRTWPLACAIQVELVSVTRPGARRVPGQPPRPRQSPRLRRSVHLALARAVSLSLCVGREAAPSWESWAPAPRPQEASGDPAPLEPPTPQSLRPPSARGPQAAPAVRQPPPAPPFPRLLWTSNSGPSLTGRWSFSPPFRVFSPLKVGRAEGRL